jgi:murein L,D-transpeptidase YcbB/YkuD
VRKLVMSMRKRNLLRTGFVTAILAAPWAPARADDLTAPAAAAAIDLPTIERSFGVIHEAVNRFKAAIDARIARDVAARNDVDMTPVGTIRSRQTGLEPELPPALASDPPRIEPAPAPVAEPAVAPAADAPALATPPDLRPDASATPPTPGVFEVVLKSFAVTPAPLNAKAMGRDWNAVRDAIVAFYTQRGFAPVWTDADGFTAAGRSLVGRLALAGEDGLDLVGVEPPPARGVGTSATQQASDEIRASEAAIAYGFQATGGRVDPKRISALITARPVIADAAATLALVAAAPDPGAALQNLNPPQKGYRDLRDQLHTLRGEASTALRTIPRGPVLSVGMIDPRVSLVRARFGLDANAPDSLVYDTKVASAVADFQRARGLPPSGALTASTITALAAGDPERQQAAILANMEMWRWQPRDMGEERIEVNVPEYTLRMMQGDAIVHQARVIVGKPDTPTPIFSNAVKYLLVNPPWNVPESIVRKEMLPKLDKDPDYLARMGFEVIHKDGIMYVRQPPGERNALGRILFMFPNEHSVYLHDTPGRGLFASRRRALSHGCVRVEDPLQLASLAMGPQSGWTEERIRALIGGGERTIMLPHPIPIHLQYFTMLVDGTGALKASDDIYGYQREVEAALGLAAGG